MLIKKTLLISATAALISSTSAIPIIKDTTIEADAQPPHVVFDSASVTDTTFPTADSDIEARDDKDHKADCDAKPTRDTTMADAINMFDLPECYQFCMRREDGKSSIHMGKDDLADYCEKKIVLIDWWLSHHIQPCVHKECKKRHDNDPHNRAREWHKNVCGHYP